MKNVDDHRTRTSKLPDQWIASPAATAWTCGSSPGQDSFLICIENKLSVLEVSSQELEASLTADEIMHVIGGLAKSESPGVDGIPNEFYQVFSTLLITDEHQELETN